MTARTTSRVAPGAVGPTALAAALVLLVTAFRPHLAALVIVVVAGAGVAAALVGRPRIAIAIAVAGVALVPTYAVPGGVPSFVRFPVGLLAALLVPAALSRLDGVRLHALDVAVAAYALVQLLAYGVTYGIVIGPGTALVARVVLPYAVCRCLGLAAGVRRAAALTWAGVAVGLSLFAVRERAVDGNLFFRLAKPGLQATQWARQELRFGDVRAEASFGHPIALGLFLALGLVLLAGLVATARPSVAGRIAAAVGAVVVAVGLTATLSRGPLLVAGGGLALWALFSVRRVRPLQVYAAGVAVGLVVVLTPVGGTLVRLLDASTGDTAEAASAQYRVRVASVLFDGDQFSMLGKASEIGPAAVSDSVSSRTGVKSYDNEFSRLYVTTGALGLLAFVAVALLVARTALRARLDAVDRAWAVGLAATLLGLVSVALLTQHGDLVWMAAGLVGAVEQEARVVSGHRTTPRAAAAGRPAPATLGAPAPTT